MRLAVCLLMCGVLSGCADNIPCKQMTSSGGVAEAAAAFTLAAYPESAECAALPTEPLASVTKQKGEALKLSLKPGTYLFVVTAYSDAGATIAIGQSCTKQKAGSGAKVCFNLIVEPLVDLATSPDLTSIDLSTPPDLHTEEDLLPPPDLVTPPDLIEIDLVPPIDLYLPPPPDLFSADLTKLTCTGEGTECPNGAGTCCGGVCIDTVFNPDNCGACGRVCSSTDTDERSCSLGLCNSTCDPKRGNCSFPASPTADNGCETNLAASVSHCGACNAACNSNAANNTARSCVDPGTCSYTCAANRKDCKVEGSNTDGCECEGTACCGASCQTKHSAGPANANWYDCDPLATYDAAHAMAACQAAGGSNCAVANCAGGTGNAVCYKDTLSCGCWTFDGTGEGKYVTALAVTPILCLAGCPTNGSPVWQ